MIAGFFGMVLAIGLLAPSNASAYYSFFTTSDSLAEDTASLDAEVTVFETDVDLLRCVTPAIIAAYVAEVEDLENKIDNIVSFNNTPVRWWAKLASQLSQDTFKLDAKVFKARLRKALRRVYGKPPCPTPKKKDEDVVPRPGPPDRPRPPRPEVGLYLGGQIIKNGARVRSIETSAATGAITNQFSDDGDPIGLGIVAGYNFAPWNNWIIGPFVSVDWLKQTVNHTFAGGFYLGTTTHWIITAGGKAGYMVAPNAQLYGLAGVAWLNHDLNINFAPGLSSQNTTTPGFTLGLGGEYQPSSWQVSGHPVSLFLQYQHTWYGTANFNTPTPASPTFNYAFKRTDDTIKFGVNIYLSAPTPTPTRALITK